MQQKLTFDVCLIPVFHIDWGVVTLFNYDRWFRLGMEL